MGVLIVSFLINRLCRFLPQFRFDLEEIGPAIYYVFIYDVLAALRVVGEFVHQVQHDFFAHGSQGAGAGVALEGAFGDALQRAGGEGDFCAF